MDAITLQIDPVAFAIGPLIIRWYALAYLAGFLIGWKYCSALVSRNEKSEINKEHIADFLTWAIIGVIIGGRLGYVLFYNFGYYLSEPVEIIKIWNGGMSFHGGLLGVIVALILYSKFTKVPLFKLSDVVCAAAPIGLFFGRIANFVNGELYGMPTGAKWGVIFPESGDLPRHPSQLYEAALEGIVLFVILWFVVRNANVRTGTASGIFLIGYGLFRALVEFVRVPDAQIGLVGGVISMGQILCLPMIALGIVIVFLAHKGRLYRPE